MHNQDRESVDNPPEAQSRARLHQAILAALADLGARQAGPFKTADAIMRAVDIHVAAVAGITAHRRAVLAAATAPRHPAPPKRPRPLDNRARDRRAGKPAPAPPDHRYRNAS